MTFFSIFGAPYFSIKSNSVELPKSYNYTFEVMKVNIILSVRNKYYFQNPECHQCEIHSKDLYCVFKIDLDTRERER